MQSEFEQGPSEIQLIHNTAVAVLLAMHCWIQITTHWNYF